MSFAPRFTISHPITVTLTRIERACGFLEALCPRANRRTLQRDLKAMVDKGLFAERGTGPTDPTRHYRLAEAILGPGKEL